VVGTQKQIRHKPWPQEPKRENFKPVRGRAVLNGCAWRTRGAKMGIGGLSEERHLGKSWKIWRDWGQVRSEKMHQAWKLTGSSENTLMGVEYGGWVKRDSKQIRKED
jgi:hypothetical protein